jgi:hypothetical protein
MGEAEFALLLLLLFVSLLEAEFVLLGCWRVGRPGRHADMLQACGVHRLIVVASC